MTVKLYIAGSSSPSERARVDRAFKSAAQIPGVEVVGDWRHDIDIYGANDVEDPVTFAKKDLDAILECDVLWLLICATGCGRGVEFGYVLFRSRTERVTMIASGDHGISIFSALADYPLPLDSQAVWRLREIAEGRGE